MEAEPPFKVHRGHSCSDVYNPRSYVYRSASPLHLSDAGKSCASWTNHDSSACCNADGVSYGAGDYRNAIQTIYDQMALDESLLEDDRRVEINVPYV